MTPRTLALVMIARDEARCIERSLASIRPWVDEMIVLDTGSSDATVTLAQQVGAQVHHFTWIDDFSAARNAALALSTADWLVVLDADEVLDPTSAPALQALRQMPPNFLGRVEIRSRFAQMTALAASGSAAAAATDTEQCSTSWMTRVLPAGVLYQGRIHEQVVSDLPRRDLAVAVLHDGYLPAQMQAKGDRNRHLLEAAVQDAPNDSYLRYQLGKDHEVHDRFEAAWPHYEHALHALGLQAGREPPWRHDLMLRAIYTLKATGRLEEAVHLAQAEMPHWPDSPDYFFVLGDLLLDFALAHPEQADELLPMIRDAWEHCLAIGENPALEGAVRGRGSFLAQHNLRLLPLQGH